MERQEPAGEPLRSTRINIETLCKSCHQKEHKCWESFKYRNDEECNKAASRRMSELNRKLPRDSKGRLMKEK